MLQDFRATKWLAAALIGLLGLSSAAIGGLWQDRKTNGFTLQLVPTQNAITPGEPVWKTGETVRVLVVIINDSKRTIHFSLSSPWSDWDMDVRDEAGNPVPEKDEFLQEREKQKGLPVTDARNILVTLKPHERSQDNIEISSRYELRKPGKYFVEVRREFLEVSKDPVLSNRLEFTIVP